jgi:antirestriction protein ArdC
MAKRTTRKQWASKGATSQADIYQAVTDKIVAALEQGAGAFVTPWAEQGPPSNAVTGKPYRGTNMLLLWVAGMQRQYSSPLWLTFKQAQSLGGCVKKGEKGTHLVRWVTYEDKKSRDPKTGEPVTRAVPKWFVVFNVEQTDVDPSAYAKHAVKVLSASERRAQCDAFIAATGATLTHNAGGRAFYSLTADAISLPPFESFKTPEGYYSTAFHELGHWTGHASRCARQLANRFGSEAYAAEELIAELTSAFICARFGITSNVQHPEYIASWIKVLQSDKRAIFTAASQASKAADYLTGAVESADESTESDERIAA